LAFSRELLLIFDPNADTDLIALDASHLFETHTTWIGFRRGSVLRAYMYDLLELLAPHLPKKFVKKAEQFKTQEKLDRKLSSLSVPERGI
jgi:LysR family transcriptional regulator, cys regulon transcriptional activator